MADVPFLGGKSSSMSKSETRHEGTSLSDAKKSAAAPSATSNNGGDGGGKPNASGVWRNKRLVHACTTIHGSTVRLQTKDGSVWEGIFSAFSSDFTICLQLAMRIDPKLINAKDSFYASLKAGSQAKDKAFFELKDVVHMTCTQVDLNYATKDPTRSQLPTDSDISGFDKTKLGERRELESWQDDDGDNTNTDSMMSLDDVAPSSGNKSGSQNKSRGWDAQDMFRYNERVHKVTTTYDEKLTGYTLPLPQHDNEDWRKKNEQAATLAHEIESNLKSQSRLAKEDEGDCEEEKFSAVHRPIPQANNHNNRNPQLNQKRDTQDMFRHNERVHKVATTNDEKPTGCTQPLPQHDNEDWRKKNEQSAEGDEGDCEEEKSSEMHRPIPQANNRNLQLNQKNFRNRNNRTSKTIDELKSFSTKMNLAAKDLELAKKSKLNPNAKEFVLKPRSPAGVVETSPVAPAPYYPQVPMYPQAHQFIPNQTSPHVNQVQYISPVPTHFAQQRYIRNFQGYQYRGDYYNTARPDYSQASMMPGQPFVPPPHHPINAYAPSPQQPMIYGGPPQPMYPVVQASFPQHMPPQMMQNPPPYGGNTVYMPSPSQN